MGSLPPTFNLGESVCPFSEKWSTSLTRVVRLLRGQLFLWIDCGVSLDCPSLSTPTRRLAPVASHRQRASSARPASAPTTFITRRRYRLAHSHPPALTPHLPESPFPFCFILFVFMVRLRPCPALPEAFARTPRARSVPPVSRARHGGTVCGASRMLREESWCSVFFFMHLVATSCWCCTTLLGLRTVAHARSHWCRLWLS